MSTPVQAVSQASPPYVRLPLIKPGANWTYVQALFPDAILASSGLSGVVASIDESVDTPDGNWLLGG